MIDVAVVVATTAALADRQFDPFWCWSDVGDNDPGNGLFTDVGDGDFFR